MNRLSQTTSPYLLQHADNPVDWYPWGEEALARARSEDKPIFLSIGYAACHWCHVMAHESFQDPETAAMMNEHFINIKVDREERPDLDSIYMSATMAMTGSGGWPMSVFLNPELQPFYAGTYFPPDHRYNLPSFRELLQAISDAWRDERDDLTRVSSQVTAHLQAAATTAPPAGMPLTPSMLENATAQILQTYDWGSGGWGGPPKFPQPMTIEFLLRRASPGDVTASEATDAPQALKAALHALQAMARGGMYDVVGGGFHRYSVESTWRVPHFEKMLYDNAQLALVYLHAWQITGKSFYRNVTIATLDFVARELTSPEGGFHSSLDADSQGEEGKFYVWSLDQINAVLGQDADFFVSAYHVTAAGNWEGSTILQRALDDASLAARFELDLEQVADRLAKCHAALLSARTERVRPATDDKVLTGWNALMLQAYAEAARTFAETDLGAKYYALAARNAGFLLSALRPNGSLRRAWRAGQASGEVFLEDYAALIVALLELYQTDFNVRWFVAARELADEMIARFADIQGGFFDVPEPGTAEDTNPSLLFRPKDIQDSATPSGNALACDALLRLAAFTDSAEYRQRAEEMLGSVTESAIRYPTTFARWLQAADFGLGSVKQIAVIGDPAAQDTRDLLTAVRSAYRPRMIVAASAPALPDGAPPLLKDRPLRHGRATAFVCEGFVCKAPVTSPEELRAQL